MSFLWAAMVLTIALAGSSYAGSPGRVLGLLPPVDVATIDACADGGSIKGHLVDAQGTEYHFFIKAVWGGGGPCPWYVGAEYSTGQAEQLPEVDLRKDAIRAVLTEWLDRTYTNEEQELILTNPRIDPRPDFTPPPEPRIYMISEPDSSVLADTTLTIGERRCEFNSHFAMDYTPYVQPEVGRAWRIMKFLGRRAGNQ